jgi:hypothetical protein
VANPKIELVADGDRLVTYNPETAAGWLLEHGYRRPWHAELVLDRAFRMPNDDLPHVFRERLARPPVGVRAPVRSGRGSA